MKDKNWRIKNLGKYAKKGCIPVRKLNLDEKEIIRLYTEEKKTCKEIGEIFNCHLSAINRRLKQSNVNTSLKGKPKSEEHKENLRKPKSVEAIEKMKETKKRLFNEGKIKIWNVGLTKEIDERVRKNAEGTSKTMKKLYKEEKLKPTSGCFKERDPRISGKNNPNWNNGSSFEPYGPEFNNKFKRAIRKRDNQICMLCGVHREKLNKAFDIHHIDGNKKLSIPQNCISLCHKCNMFVNTNREHWAKHFQELLFKLYGYPYSENREIILEVNQK